MPWVKDKKTGERKWFPSGGVSRETVQKIIDESTISDEKLTAAVEEALTQAKESGEFKGEPGYTPQKGIDYFDGRDGDDYILTEADKTEIAEEAAKLVEIPDGGGSGGGSTEWRKIADETLTEDVASWAVTLDKAYKRFKILICAFSVANVSASSAWIEINIGEGKRYLGKPRYQTNLAAETDIELVDGYLITACKTTSVNNVSGAVADIGWKLATTTNLTETKNITLFGEAYLKTGARIIIFAEESA